MSPRIILITGANRGIGRGILELYLAKPNHIVIAANRDPNHPTSKELLTLPTAAGTAVKVVKLNVNSPTDAEEATQTLKTQEGIDHIDIYIANAAIAYAFPKIEDVRVEDMRVHFETNVVGFVRVYQALLPLLKASSDDPKLVTIGSAAAYLTVCSTLLLRNMIPAPNAAYAPTKLVQHWYTKTIANTEPWLTAFPIDPGFVQSDLGNNAAMLLGLEQAPVTVKDSTQGVIKVIDASTKETHSGKLWKWTGEQEPW
ncbi:NAD(P)-binding protein [Aspergillus undulatus]|uniref:NAD(P)-binding protein n=1 Tax=Aspergillus undulatus TaxID=1810928 RepID=UPI003CCDC591